MPKGHLIFRPRTLHLLFVRGVEVRRRRSGKKLKKVTRRQAVASVVDLSAEGREQKATSLKVTWYIISISDERCPGNYTWKGKKIP